MIQGIGSFYQDFFNLVFPPRCPYCEKPLLNLSGSGFGSRFCESCLEKITPDDSERCSVCDAPSGAYSSTEEGCYHCGKERYYFDHVKSLGVYSNELRNICLRAKESSGRPLVSASVNLFWEYAGDSLLAQEFDLIIPVPFYWTDRVWRSHCPPETIARELASRMKVPCSTKILKKIQRTKKQSSLPASRRRSNVRNAFAVRRSQKIAGKKLLLVDDILTTGSTASEAARCLRKAGAGEVSVMVLARALKGARFFQQEV